MNPVDVGQWIANYGFPAVFALYLLIRIEPAINELTKTVQLLSIIVAKTNGMDYTDIEKNYQDKPLGRDNWR